MQYLKTYRTFHTITHIIILAIENANCFSFKSISTIYFCFIFTNQLDTRSKMRLTISIMYI